MARFDIRWGVLLYDVGKSCSRKIAGWDSRIALQFDRSVSSLMRQWNFRAIEQLWWRIPRLRDFARSYKNILCDIETDPWVPAISGMQIFNRILKEPTTHPLVMRDK